MDKTLAPGGHSSTLQSAPRRTRSSCRTVFAVSQAVIHLGRGLDCKKLLRILRLSSTQVLTVCRLYLTLYFCSKFSIGLPHLPTVFNTQQRTRRPTSEHELLPLHSNQARGSSAEDKLEAGMDVDGANDQATMSANPLAVRNAAAAPPNYLIIPALLPVGVAVYICSTRYAEYYHFGFDIIFGSLIGIATSWLAFRWYHLPISRGQGWAWGARSKDRSFAIGVGSGGYVGPEGWHSTKSRQSEVS